MKAQSKGFRMASQTLKMALDKKKKKVVYSKGVKEKHSFTDIQESMSFVLFRSLLLGEWQYLFVT